MEQLLRDLTEPFGDALYDALIEISGSVTKATEPILRPVFDGLLNVYDAVQEIERAIVITFDPKGQLATLIQANPDLWSAAKGSDIVFRDLLVGHGVITQMEASLLQLPDVIGIINEVATLKVLGDMIAGNASIADLLGKVSEGRSFETARSIALLSKEIMTTGINIMDLVDTNVGILKASIEGFDERVKENLRIFGEEAKAEILKAVTPRIDRLGLSISGIRERQDNIFAPKLSGLGRYQMGMNRGIARVFRHVEDQPWFMYMLIRALK